MFLSKLFARQLNLQTIQKSNLPSRAFSRADIKKTLDPKQIGRRDFLHNEITNNPEFFKAYPHYQAIFGISEDGQEINEMNQYNHEILTNLKDGASKEVPFFNSLLHQQNHYLATEDKEEIIRDNEKHFVESYESPVGPLKYMNRKEIIKIHQIIDKKMQELEDSGLTRDEILYDRQVLTFDIFNSLLQQTGIPLADDPFFQFVKNSKAAREMLIKPNEEFTAERVIEKALRQDIGPDPTLALNRVDYQFEDKNNLMFHEHEYKKKYRDKDPALNPEAYFYDNKLLERRKREIDFSQEKPATFINRPLSRSQLRRKLMRNLRKKDIDWKDTPLLVKFLNSTGKIMNRFQTRLKTSVQRKLAKTIKKIRDLNLISHVGLIKPTDKIPMGSFMEDLEEMHKKTIDPVTGRLFLKHSLQDDLPTKEKRVKEILEDRFSHVENIQDFNADEKSQARAQVIREMTLDDEKLIPNRKQRNWLAAQAHILEKEGILHMGAKEAYEETYEQLKKLDPTPGSMFEMFIAEKSLNINRIDEFHAERGLKVLHQKAEYATLQQDESDKEIRSRIQKIMAEYADPSFNKVYKHENELTQKWDIRSKERRTANQ
ncbi:30s ribosomal protein s18 [Stylonychia lemnae]|uniref:30s ribosomal protein s18 n=1 Tax=Stylonychia lemnae TaxID=5949 RepID=A0A078AL15_STYLE|nr:30s ribosomal protein s18 [Stylonychia lemnae]|eukprot:CDW82874.1 30s ribosomal protein s18 [Stylonychia lemnae]